MTAAPRLPLGTPPCCAECAAYDADPLYPSDPDWPSLVKARALCRSCPMLTACAAYALGPGRADPGILAGMTHTERVQGRYRERTLALAR